jgi:hypothetical protein
MDIKTAVAIAVVSARLHLFRIIDNYIYVFTYDYSVGDVFIYGRLET